MTRKDGSLALLAVVVWGLNLVVIKLIAQYAAADAGGPALYAGRLPGAAFVARPAIPLRLLLGYGLTISFGQFAFCSAQPSAWHAGGAGVAGKCRRKPLPSFLAPSSLANAYRASSWRGSRWRSSACWCWWREPRRGACPTGGLYADPGGGAQLACGNIFNKIMSQATRPPIISLVVERIDPGAAVYVCLVADRRLQPACWRVYARSIWRRSSLYLAFIATLVGYGIWGSLLGR